MTDSVKWGPFKRSWAIALIVAAVLSPFLITAALVMAFGPDEEPVSGLPGRPDAPTRTSFNVIGLPPVQTDPCPTPAQQLPQPVTGKNALPDLTLECIGAIGSSQTVQMNRLGGVPTVVNIWSTSCEPCKREMPDLQRVHEQAAGKLRILGVNSNDYAEGARVTIRNTGISFASVADPDELFRPAIGSALMPTTLFVSAEGRIVHRKVGQFVDEADLRSDIAEHLGVQL